MPVMMKKKIVIFCGQYSCFSILPDMQFLIHHCLLCSHQELDFHSPISVFDEKIQKYIFLLVSIMQNIISGIIIK